MRKAFLVVTSLLLMTTLLASCISVRTGVTGFLVKEDDEIDPLLRQEIVTLNTQISEVVKKADFEGFLGYFATGISDETILKQQLQDIFPSLTKYISEHNIETYREYYVKKLGSGNTQATFPLEKDKDFKVSVNLVNDETYAFFGIDDEFYQSLTTEIYAKQNGRWKLHNFYVGALKIAGKNAEEWYQEATLAYDKGNLVPASFKIQVANRVLRPSPFAKYDSEAKITDYVKKLQDEVNAKYAFPIALSSLKSNPVIYHIEPVFTDDPAVVPRLRYVTAIPLDDEKMLKQEANAMSPIVQEMFPGIAEGSPQIIFTAFSEPPTDPNKTYQSYGTIVEVK